MDMSGNVMEKVLVAVPQAYREWEPKIPDKIDLEG